MIGTWWGVEPNILRMVYISLIRSSPECGSHVFNFSSHKYFDKIEKIRNQALRLAIGYRGSTPINVILAKCCEPPSKKDFPFWLKNTLLKPLRTLIIHSQIYHSLFWTRVLKKESQYHQSICPSWLCDLFKMAQPSSARRFVFFISRGVPSPLTCSWPDIQSSYKAGILPTKSTKKKKKKKKKK